MLKLTSEELAVGLLFAAIAVLAVQTPAHSDTWWLMRAGQDIATTLSVPMVDSYTYTVAGQPWPNHEWLTELLFFVLYSTGGMALVTALCAASIIATLSLSWRLCRGEFEGKFLLMSAVVASTTLTWALRPQVLTALCFVTAVTLLVRRRWRWLPVLFFIWANLHGAVALGLVALAGAMVADIIITRRVSPRLIGIALLSAGATCLTPNGLELWSFIVHSVNRLRGLDVMEWRMPDASWQFWLFWATAAALPVLTLWRHAQLSPQNLRLVVIALSVLPLAVQSIRNVPVFLLVAVPALTRFFPPASAKKPSRGEHPRANGAVALAAAGLVLIFTAAVWLRPTASMNWRPLSPAAMAAIDTCPDNIFNTFGNGGEIIWFLQHRRVFVDNRQDPFSFEFLKTAQAAELGAGFPHVADRYRIRCAVVPPQSAISGRLERDPAWRSVYRDGRWAVFTR